MKIIKSAYMNPCTYGDKTFSVTVTYVDGTSYTLYDPTPLQMAELQRELQIQIYLGKLKC